MPTSKTAGTGIPIPTLKKAQRENRALIFTDEASFRQDSTRHATGSRVGQPPEIPVTGERKNVKIRGAIELWPARFPYQQDAAFHASTSWAFLQHLACHYRRRGAILIPDHASYHQDADVGNWFRANRPWLAVHPRPPSSPEFNPTERLWPYARKNGTPNRYCARPAELATTRSRVLGEMRSSPELIGPCLLSFC